MVQAKDQVEVNNDTNESVFAAMYSVPLVTGKVQRSSSVISIGAHDKKNLDRPNIYPGYDRDIAFSKNESDLKSDFGSPKNFKAALSRVNAGQTRGNTFYIAMEGNGLEGYNAASWKLRSVSNKSSDIFNKAKELGNEVITEVNGVWVAQTTMSATKSAINGVIANVSQAFKDQTIGKYSAYWKSPYENKVASVRVGAAVAPGEKEVQIKRTAKIKQALEKKLGPITYVPKIAVVSSGGGSRALILHMGWLVGAQKAGLLDTIMWLSALSGSTWSLGSWYQNALLNKGIQPDVMRESLLKAVGSRVLQKMTTAEIRQMNSLFLVAATYEKPFTAVNLWGAMIGNNVLVGFDDSKQVQKLSSQMDVVNEGNYPIPVYTAVNGEAGKDEKYWYAFTPWEVSLEPWKKGGEGISIPMWGLGRKYKNGESQGYSPEQSLGFCLGTFGSAIAVDFDTMYDTVKDDIDSPLINAILQEVLKQVGEQRLTWAAVANFMNGISQSPFKDQKQLKMVDAGLAFNLPYPPVSGMRADRSPDIIIFMDGSGGIEGGGSKPTVVDFRAVEAYARSKGLKYPVIDYKDILKRAVTVFKDPNDPSVPTVIYMPWVKDAEVMKKLSMPEFKEFEKLKSLDRGDCCSTMKGITVKRGGYSYDEAMLISQLTECNVKASADVIWKEIAERAQPKKKK
jgi:Lysophospholipase catalytic domain.